MFDDRLKDLRISAGLTQKQVADALEIKVNTYQSYELDKREPTAIQLKRMATFYNVSCDYLLGFEKMPEPPRLTTEQEIIEYLNKFTDSQKNEVKLFCEFIDYRNKGD